MKYSRHGGHLEQSCLKVMKVAEIMLKKKHLCQGTSNSIVAESDHTGAKILPVCSLKS